MSSTSEEVNINYWGGPRSGMVVCKPGDNSRDCILQRTLNIMRLITFVILIFGLVWWFTREYILKKK
jgi:hypothetical protein